MVTSVSSSRRAQPGRSYRHGLRANKVSRTTGHFPTGHRLKKAQCASLSFKLKQETSERSITRKRVWFAGLKTVTVGKSQLCGRGATMHNIIIDACLQWLGLTSLPRQSNITVGLDEEQPVVTVPIVRCKHGGLLHCSGIGPSSRIGP